MADLVDLPTQVAAARRELEMRRRVYPHWVNVKKMGQAKADEEIANMEAIIRTLEWLAENEAKIKARVATVDEHDAEPLGEVESTNVYKAGNAVFLDMSKGGYEQRREVTDEAGRVIGTRIDGRKTRADKPYTYFEPAGYQCFQTAKAFIEAYERGDWKAREIGVAA